MVRFKENKLVIEIACADPKEELAELQKCLIDILGTQKEDTYANGYFSSMYLLEFLYQTTEIDG